MTNRDRPMLHCILRDSHPLPILPPGVRGLAAEGLIAVVSDVDTALVRTADRPALQRFADLTAGLHRTANLIPMRFGCVLDDDAAVGRLLGLRRERLSALLERLDGCVELGARLLLSTPEPQNEPQNDPAQPRDPSPRGPGHAHLASVRRRIRGDARIAEQARSVRASIETAARGLFRDAREELGQIAGQHLLSLYYLVPRASYGPFVDALRLAADPCGDRCLVTGPWPPYNFVGAIDDDLRCLA